MEKQVAGFTLIELAVVTAVIGVLSLILVPSLIDVLESRQIETERANLVGLEEDIKRSFQDVDWSRNLASFPQAMPEELSAQYATVFGECSEGAPAADGAWYVKLTRLRGVTPSIGTPVSAEHQKAVYDVAFNSFGKARLLIAGPAEPNQQRYLLVSLLAPETTGLVIPANDGSADWFDAIWNGDWENESAGLPQAWMNRLSETQQKAWLAGRGQTTHCHQLVVRRLVQPRYTVTLNNAHPTFSGCAQIAGRLPLHEIEPNDPPKMIPGVLAGSLVVFRRGPANNEVEVFRIHLNDNTAFTVQAGGP